MARECRCSCDAFALVLRIFSFLACLATGGAAGWGFLLADARWRKEKPAVGADVVTSLLELNKSMALFQGLMAVYYCLFAILGAMAEVRTKWLSEHAPLKSLNFLKSYFGRGCYLIYIGSVFVLIPWDDDRPWVSKACGGMLLGAGVLQMLFWTFVKKHEKRNLPTSSAPGAGAPKFDDADGSVTLTSSRQVTVGSTPVFANPVHPSNLAATASFRDSGSSSSPTASDGGAPRESFAPVPTSADGVPVRNPFHGAGGPSAQ